MKSWHWDSLSAYLLIKNVINNYSTSLSTKLLFQRMNWEHCGQKIIVFGRVHVVLKNCFCLNGKGSKPHVPPSFFWTTVIKSVLQKIEMQRCTRHFWKCIHILSDKKSYKIIALWRSYFFKFFWNCNYFSVFWASQCL